MSSDSPRTFTADFRRFFLRGLVVLLPTVLTLWLVVYAYLFVHDVIAEPINRGVRVAIAEASKRWEPIGQSFEPTEEAMANRREELATERTTVPNDEQIRVRLRRESIAAWWSERWYMDVIGLVVAIIAVYLAGRLLGGLIGRRVYRRLESFITTVPVFKQVYPYVKQIVDFLFSEKDPLKFSRVVACEYPRRGIWSVGFLTGDSLRDLRSSAGDSVTVFIPSSPTPFTGYTITVPRDEIIELPMTVEEAIRFAVSAGVLVPNGQQVGVPSETNAGPTPLTGDSEPPGVGTTSPDAASTSEAER